MEEISLLDTVGRTPMVRIQKMLPEAARHARVLVKLEMQNPGGSIKDRIAKSIIEKAEAEGKLLPGGTVVEGTSGNTGIGLAMVCAAKGYRCIIVMPQLPTFLERYIICRQFGAEVHLTAPGKGFAGIMEHYKQLLAENPSYFGSDQFGNDANPAIHRATTGPEVWEQAGGKVDFFIHGVGTGGTLAGAGGYLKSMNTDTKVICVEPSNARVHVGGIGALFDHLCDPSM
jgi:cysteine synthase A